ncbi:YchJ family protein [Methylomonas sp. SURF-2]|uniref:YchJ family protein n=1 Tax=Methylomonas subterranea TaxID=2952225 RepID=A0ABT1TC27_9GAMM|nr:YchJ family protein [Methylomonas sp. SURF-2]MCQ8103017.1 YchJ family protein [Methylomonas sp. SURF-2]
MTNNTSDTETCLCGTGQAYAACCGPFHKRERRPATALELMRSRFSAYALRNAAYLLDSWDIGSRPADLDFSRETADWRSLQIVACKKGAAHDGKGIVEFKAFYRQDGEDCCLHEISRFVKTGQDWFYLDGVIKAAGKVQTANSGGNAPCACGSGKKFKRCCGR